MIIVLKRFVTGDGDIIAKVYGKGGTMNLYVRDAYEISNPFFGVFEPFNVMELSYKQSGNLIIPLDYGKLRRYSYLAGRYIMFEWMSLLSLFLLKHIRFFDPNIMSLFLDYIKDESKARNMNVYYLRFVLNISELIGILPKFIYESGYGFFRMSDGSVAEKGDVKVSDACISILRKLYSGKHVERIRMDSGTFKEAKALLDRYFEYHLQ